MSDTMSKEAQHIWSMLDDMASHDPDAYKKFIEKNLSEGKQAMRPPEPHMCVRTTIHKVTPTGRQSEKLYINIMDWPRVPAPKSDTDAIPTTSGAIYTTADSDDFKLAAVAFNPAVLKDFGINANKADELQQLVWLAIEYLRDQLKLDISKTYIILPAAQRCMGLVQEAVSSLTKTTPTSTRNKIDSQFESELTELEKSFGPMAAGCKDSVLSKLAELSRVDDVKTEQSDIKLPGGVTPKNGNKSLIEEISSSSTSLRVPHYSITKNNSTTGGAKMLLEIQLPGVESIAECQLDISEDDICLIVDDKYELTLLLPSKTAIDCATAKFSKRSSCLTLTLPIAS